MEIKIILSKSEVAEYLADGFYRSRLRELDITVSGFSSSQYNDEFCIHLSGDRADLEEFLYFYGYSSDEVEDELMD